MPLFCIILVDGEVGKKARTLQTTSGKKTTPLGKVYLAQNVKTAK